MQSIVRGGVNGVPVGTAALVLPGALAWQGTASGPSQGRLTGLERRIPALGQGSLREVPGTERRMLASQQ